MAACISPQSEGVEDTMHPDDNKHDIDDQKQPIRHIREQRSVFLDAEKNPKALSDIHIDQNSYHLDQDTDAAYAYRDTPYFIAVHELRHYKFSWDYKCAEECIFQAYVRCFDAKFREIDPQHVSRKGKPVIIKAIDTDNKTIKYEGDMSGWTPVNASAGDRIIGFNYSGNNIFGQVFANDYIWHQSSEHWSTEANKGAYCYVDDNKKIMKLSKPIPEQMRAKIIDNESVMRNHLYASTSQFVTVFSYQNAKKGVTEWNYTEHVIKGVATTCDESSGVDHSHFRKGTKYIKFGVRIWDKRSKGSLWFNHLKIEQIDIE